jgi:hypothetical protein
MTVILQASYVYQEILWIGVPEAGEHASGSAAVSSRSVLSFPA